MTGSKTGAARVLTVDRLWDGRAALPVEIVRFHLQEAPAGLGVHVLAPDHGDPRPAAPPGFCDGLWNYEVVELFVGGDSDTYFELELGPHGHHLALTLAGHHRERVANHTLSVSTTRTNTWWRASCTVPMEMLPPRPWTMNAHAIHGVGPERRCLSFTPQPASDDRPDFHRRSLFRAWEEIGARR